MIIATKKGSPRSPRTPIICRWCIGPSFQLIVLYSSGHIGFRLTQRYWHQPSYPPVILQEQSLGRLLIAEGDAVRMAKSRGVEQLHRQETYAKVGHVGAIGGPRPVELPGSCPASDIRRRTIDLVGRRRVAPTPPPPPPSRELRESPGKEERTNDASASSSASWLADPSRGSRSGFADASRPGTSSGGRPGPPRPPPLPPPSTFLRRHGGA